MSKIRVIAVLSTILIIPLISISISDATAQSWSKGAPMPTARSEIAATNLGDDIYIVGGFDGLGNALDTVEGYNVKNNSWNSMAPLPEALHHAGAASFDGKIYVIGGFISREWIPNNQLFIYDPIKDNWIAGSSMPTPRGALSAVFVNGILYAIGGQGESSVLNIIEAYNPITDSWISKSPMPTARHHASAMTVDDKIYVTGGRVVGSSPLVNVNDNEMYDSKTENWTTVTPMPSKRSGMAGTTVNSSLFVFGGEDITTTFGNNEKFDTENDIWTSLEPLPTPRHGLGAISVDERIFVIGGGAEPGLSVSNVNEIYDMK